VWLPTGHTMDATRKSDGTFVALKRVERDKHPFEEEIAEFLQSDELASDRRNHCVKVVETLELPDHNNIILVMPLLRGYDDPMFQTVGELIDCLQQLFEGLQFMHENHVAHRDCNPRNAMMCANSMYPNPWHPIQTDRKRNDVMEIVGHYSRTERPPSYYWIDFGISRRFDPSETHPLANPIKGGDKTAPEFQDITGPVNPFPTDVYYVGNLVREEFLQVMDGLEFLEPLIKDMVQDDPSKRPDMNEVVRRFEDIRKELSYSQLRTGLVFRSSVNRKRLRRAFTHWLQRLRYIILRLPPVPSRT